jgi:hypothetical protein
MGGRIRLARNNDDTVALTVTFAREDGLPRAVGFMTPVDELETVAGLALWWVTVVGAGDAALVPLPRQQRRDKEDK